MVDAQAIVRLLCNQTVERLYACPPRHRRCKQCALYVPRAALAAHMDEHFVHGALRSRAKDRRYVCRGFFPTCDEWSEARPPHAYDAEDDTSPRKPVGYKRKRSACVGEYVAHVPHVHLPDDAVAVPMRVEIDDEVHECPHCCEPIEYLYDHERDMWMYIDAVMCPRTGQPCHEACLA